MAESKNLPFSMDQSKVNNLASPFFGPMRMKVQVCGTFVDAIVDITVPQTLIGTQFLEPIDKPLENVSPYNGRIYLPNGVPVRAMGQFSVKIIAETEDVEVNVDLMAILNTHSFTVMLDNDFLIAAGAVIDCRARTIWFDQGPDNTFSDRRAETKEARASRPLPRGRPTCLYCFAIGHMRRDCRCCQHDEAAGLLVDNIICGGAHHSKEGGVCYTRPYI